MKFSKSLVRGEPFLTGGGELYTAHIASSPLLLSRPASDTVAIFRESTFKDPFSSSHICNSNIINMLNYELKLAFSCLLLFAVSLGLISSAPLTAEQVEALRVLANGQDCSDNILDCLGGPPGPRGPQGPQGPTGPVGPPGPPGSVNNFRMSVRKIVKKYLAERNLLSQNSKTVENVKGAEEEEEEEPTVIPFTGFKVAVTPVRVESSYVKFLPNGHDMTNFVDDEDQGLFNDGGHFDKTTGRFVAPENGTYHFDLIHHLTSLQRTPPMVAITTHLCVNHKCGLKGALWHSSWATTSPFTQTLSGLLRLKRGDYVSVIVFNLTEDAMQVNSMILSGYRVA